MSSFQLEPGNAFQCLSIPITLVKIQVTDPFTGQQVLKCGFKIGGGIDQNFRQSPQGFTDNGVYVTEIHPNSAASRSGLELYDKILQCNGIDFTLVTHKEAVRQIQKHPTLHLLVARRGVTSY